MDDTRFPKLEREPLLEEGLPEADTLASASPRRVSQ